VAALELELAAARVEADDLRERLQTARDGVVERDQRLMALQEAADCAAEDAAKRLDAERAEAAETRTKLAEAREAAERARAEAAAAIAAEAAETEKLREELTTTRRRADETVATERAETARLREELAARPVPDEEQPDEAGAPSRRMLDRVTRDLERERATNRTLRRDLEAAQAETAELRRASAISPPTAENPHAALRRPVTAHRVDVARAAGAHLVPDHHPSPVRLWAMRVAAALVVGLLLLALALIVVPLL
jgi:chromosome segregation ATPase